MAADRHSQRTAAPSRRMDDVQVAIDALEHLGLTEYEARCFVALTRLPHGTAKEVGQVADIPRSRVYETMERLQSKGLVEKQDGEPQVFQSVPIDTAIRMLRDEYDSYFTTLEESLHRTEPAYKETQQGVWALQSHDQVSERVRILMNDAADELLLLVIDADTLSQEMMAHLTDASERGVTVHVGSAVESVRDRIESAELDARTFTTPLIEWLSAVDDLPRVGRVVMIDRGPVLVSALHGEELPGVKNETAVWSDGINHGFATFVERVLTFELVGGAPEVDGSAETTDANEAE